MALPAHTSLGKNELFFFFADVRTALPTRWGLHHVYGGRKKKVISKRTHTTHTYQDVSTYLHSPAMALISHRPGDGRSSSSLLCCIIKHTLCALSAASRGLPFSHLDLGASFSWGPCTQGRDSWLTCPITPSESVIMFVKLDCNNSFCCLIM